ncbi:MAG: M55 family metallopeptidase [Clostridia bacterium]|nr:M55 family metallopeptidase [Clostridia bacterium]
MKKIFLSADIEGTCGIAHWNETEKAHGDEYAPFSEQMSKEVAAACEGVLAAEDDAFVFVRDSHDSARNIRPAMLPQVSNIQLFRGWGRDPYSMMSGVDESFTGVMFTGYHSACGWDGNPLSHTMNGQNVYVKVNGEVMSELMMNSLTAAMFGVPVLMVTGDQMLCDWFRTKVPDAVTVPVSYGVGNGSVSIMPMEATRRIKAGAEKAMALDAARCLYPMPDSFHVEICFRQHFNARNAAWYPGCVQTDSRSVAFDCTDWMDALKFLHFCL